ncbi:MAG: tol-pal system protein YbgF [Syntrophaceae bacterium]|nr:tol-pal system protein YbgF [Syntrophaceae bacterium]
MKSTCQGIFLGVLLLGMGCFSGCATQKDLDAVQRDSNSLTKEFLGLQRNLYDLNAELKEVSSKLDSLDKRTANLQRDVGAMSGEMKSKVGLLEKEMESSSQPMRRYQADLGARLDKLQLEVQNLTGRFEESKYFAEKTFGATKNYQTRLEELEKRVADLNKSLESMERKMAAPLKPAEEERGPAVGPSPEATPEPPAKKPEIAPKPAVAAGPDEAYKKAYDLYSKGRIDEAQKEFKKFLEAYPKSKYVENSHFWLGECYFSQKKYEDAILEYDEVIKKFPKGNKVPDALYRQGMAFLEMKDTTNAKLILKEVLRRFPQSDQANRARKKLQEIG